MMERVGKAMLSFAEFEKVMNNVKKFWDRQTEIEKATDGCLNVWEMTNGGCIDDVLMLLQKMFNDTEEWISYWVYELKWGNDYEPGCVRNADGSNIELATIRDLFNFLIKNFMADDR